MFERVMIKFSNFLLNNLLKKGVSMNNTNGRAVKIKPTSKSRVTLVISKTLIKKLKLKALDSESTISSIATQAINEYLSNFTE